MNYTKGGWKSAYIGQGMYNIEINGDTNDVVAIVDNYYEHHNGDAIANLIAAAPDMYEALEAIVDHFRHNHDDYYISDLCTDALAALNKAEGK
jgi:predicted small metal-binding protein